MFETLFGKKTSALVVEDEPAIRELISSYLKMEKFSVTQAANGEEAMKVLASFQPDLLVTDLLMPKMSGAEFIREFRKKQPKTPIIVVTGIGATDVCDQLKERWTNLAILLKPFKASDLLQAAKDATGAEAKTLR